jgi:hypothetical protein
MTNSLKDKLQLALSKKLDDECRVVYILSRIRKLMDLDTDLNSNYKVLRKYCDWSLHAKIDRIEPLKKILEEFLEHKDHREKILSHDEFVVDFKLFIKNILFVDLTDDYIKEFIYRLNFILSDTPIELNNKYGYKKISIILHPEIIPKLGSALGYQINYVK